MDAVIDATRFETAVEMRQALLRSGKSISSPLDLPTSRRRLIATSDTGVIAGLIVLGFCIVIILLIIRVYFYIRSLRARIARKLAESEAAAAAVAAREAAAATSRASPTRSTSPHNGTRFLQEPQFPVLSDRPRFHVTLAKVPVRLPIRRLVTSYDATSSSIFLPALPLDRSITPGSSTRRVPFVTNAPLYPSPRDIIAAARLPPGTASPPSMRSPSSPRRETSPSRVFTRTPRKNISPLRTISPPKSLLSSPQSRTISSAATPPLQQQPLSFFHSLFFRKVKIAEPVVIKPPPPSPPPPPPLSPSHNNHVSLTFDRLATPRVRVPYSLPSPKRQLTLPSITLPSSALIVYSNENGETPMTPRRRAGAPSPVPNNRRMSAGHMSNSPSTTRRSTSIPPISGSLFSNIHTQHLRSRSPSQHSFVANATRDTRSSRGRGIRSPAAPLPSLESPPHTIVARNITLRAAASSPFVDPMTLMQNFAVEAETRSRRDMSTTPPPPPSPPSPPPQQRQEQGDDVEEVYVATQQLALFNDNENPKGVVFQETTITTRRSSQSQGHVVSSVVRGDGDRGNEEEDIEEDNHSVTPDITPPRYY